MMMFKHSNIAFVVLSLAIAAIGIARAETTKPLGERTTVYSPFGKRDPFRVPAVSSSSREISTLQPLEKYALEQFQLKAILRGLGRPKAMFEDPDGKTHILTEGDVIGREKASVSRIVDSEVIMTQRTFNYLGAESLLEKVISLPQDGADLLDTSAKTAQNPAQLVPSPIPLLSSPMVPVPSAKPPVPVKLN